MEIYLFAPEAYHVFTGIPKPIFAGVTVSMPSALVENMDTMSLMYLESLVRKQQDKAYVQKQDKDIMQPVVFHKVGKDMLIFLTQVSSIAENLQTIGKDTRCTPLQDYIKYIFSCSIEIRPYGDKE